MTLDYKKGERVGAVIGTENKEVRFLGFGVYEGDFKLPKKALGFNFGQKNPKIKLDSGKVVYGCECWWCSEEGMNDKLKEWKKAKYKIINVDIDQIRKKCRKTSKEVQE